MVAETPLYLAVRNRQKGAIDTLILNGANKAEVLLNIIRTHDTVGLSTIITHMEDNEIPNNMMHHAIEHDRSGMIVSVLISWGYGVNNEDKRGYTPLHYAAHLHMYNCCKELIKAGSNVNKTAFDGQTPLYEALSGFQRTKDVNKVCDILLLYGANKSAKYRGLSIMDVVAMINDKSLTEVFDYYN